MRAESPGRESWTVTIAIWLAFAATFAAVVVISQTPLAVEIEERLDEVHGRDSLGPDVVAGEIAARILRSPAPRRDELAAQAVREQRPDVLMALYLRLSTAEETALLAVRLLDIAAERYQHAEIMVQAAREYSVGRIVEKDYTKAIRLYRDPLIFRLPGVKYYLAEIYLAEDNPEQDVGLAFRLLRESARLGHAKATQRLQQLGEIPAVE